MKFKSSFQATMWIVTILMFLCMVISFGIYSMTEISIFNVLGITALTTFYHFGIRLFLGEWLLKKLVPTKIDYNKKWFQSKPFEPWLYKKMKVKSWKLNMPTYDPQAFSLEKHSLEEIVMAMCNSEIVHTCNVVVSFVPLLFSLKFGTFVVFLLTSVGAACFDLVFVMMQRYNRPRLMKMMKKMGK